MKKSRFSEAEIFKIIKANENGLKVTEITRQYGVSSATFYHWRSKYGGMDLAMIKKMKELEDENRRLKKMYAEACMDREILQEVIEKKL